jgi:hypothetical protein
MLIMYVCVCVVVCMRAWANTKLLMYIQRHLGWRALVSSVIKAIRSACLPPLSSHDEFHLRDTCISVALVFFCLLIVIFHDFFAKLLRCANANIRAYALD